MLATVSSLMWKLLTDKQSAQRWQTTASECDSNATMGGSRQMLWTIVADCRSSWKFQLLAVRMHTPPHFKVSDLVWFVNKLLLKKYRKTMRLGFEQTSYVIMIDGTTQRWIGFPTFSQIVWHFQIHCSKTRKTHKTLICSCVQAQSSSTSSKSAIHHRQMFAHSSRDTVLSHPDGMSAAKVPVSPSILLLLQRATRKTPATFPH